MFDQLIESSLLKNLFSTFIRDTFYSAYLFNLPFVQLQEQPLQKHLSL